MNMERSNDVSPEGLQARIWQARSEAAKLRYRIERKKDELAGTTLRQVATQAHEEIPQNQLTKADRAWKEAFNKPVKWMTGSRQTSSRIAISTSADAKGQLKSRDHEASSMVYSGMPPVAVRNPEAFDVLNKSGKSVLALPVAYTTRKRRYIPLKINGQRIFGLPDNACSGNAITEDCARTIGADVKRSQSPRCFVNAEGQSFASIGTTEPVVSIPGALSHRTPGRKWAFAVVKQLAAPLVLGDDFLQITGALTSLAHLLVKKALSVIKGHSTRLRTLPRFMHMGSRTQALGCFLGNKSIYVGLDTGSDIDAVSLNYAQSRSWQIQTLPEDKAYVLLANNKLVKLTGYIDTRLRIQGICVPKRLFVLEGLVCDVVLGDPTIEALNIFDEFKSSIVDVMEPQGTNAFRMIQWIESIDQMADEVEQLVLNGQDNTGYTQKQTVWNSILRRKVVPKRTAAHDEVVMQRLKIMLEVFDVCSANWRRAVESELSTLVDDACVRKKEEIESRKDKNKQIRDKILLSISARSQGTTPGSTPELRTGSQAW